MNTTPRTDAALKRCNQNSAEVGISDLAIMLDNSREIERELREATRSPYIDNEERPVDVIEAIHEALDGITADSDNAMNSGSLVSRVKAAVSMAGQLAETNAQRDALAEALRDVVEGNHGAIVRAKKTLAAVKGDNP